MRVYRILERRHLATAFTGEGAHLYGGRWNSPGVRMIYTASSLPLAILEMLVNGMDLPSDLVYITIDLADPPRIDAGLLPPNGNVTPAPVSLRTLGDNWIQSKSSVALAVPSALTPIDDNILLNPEHAAFAGLVIGSPAEIALDWRLRR